MSNYETLTPEQISLRFEALNSWIDWARGFALYYFSHREELTIENKSSPMDLVSKVDKEIEISFRDFVKKRFPADGVVGEEQGIDNIQEDQPVWVIDPIDGTMPFLLGLPGWGISVALIQSRQILMGIIDQPAKKEKYYAIKGKGAFMDGSRIQIDQNARIGNKPIAAGYAPRSNPDYFVDFLKVFLKKGGTFMKSGACVDMMMSVASGHLGAYYEPHINAWDCMAGLIIVREAGGVDNVTPDMNFLTRGGKLISGNPAIVKELSQLDSTI